MENNKGILRQEIDTIEIHDFNLMSVIVDNLLEKGYDITTKHILEKGQQIGESLTIYTTEKR
ncbi:hypothetical protein [uncultured Clostridium sp.]|uniref:hypothetical protein n=1 Tax=uncultured Clostridium sp. TaxID=59620 RepID=UPI003216A331